MERGGICFDCWSISRFEGSRRIIHYPEALLLEKVEGERKSGGSVEVIVGEVLSSTPPPRRDFDFDPKPFRFVSILKEQEEDLRRS